MAAITFTKNSDLHNILYDEFFSPHAVIEVIAFNYDGKGRALCHADGLLTQMDLDTVNKIMFGVPVTELENYLRGIFDPNFGSGALRYENGRIVFSMGELNKLKKYDIDNLAKKTLKELQTFEGDHFRYFAETAADAVTPATTGTEVYGNTKSLVFHRPDCKSFSAITCTSLFSSAGEAASAGYKACKICHPEGA